MAGKNEFHYLLSSSDQNILNAFNQLKDIENDFNVTHVPQNTKSYNPAISLYSKVADSVFVSPCKSLCNGNDSTCSMSDSENVMSSTSILGLENCNSLKLDPVYAEVVQNLSTICKMFHSLNQQKDIWQAKYKAYKQETIDFADPVISTSELRRRLERINLVVGHLKEISENVSKLKHALRTVDQSDCLKIHIEYHKNVVDFFDMAKIVMKDLDEDLANFTNIKDSDYRELANMELIKKVHKLTTMLHKSMDAIKEFKGHLQTLPL